MKVEKGSDAQYFDFHFFVCTNVRDTGEDCAGKGSPRLLEALKKWSKEQGLGKKVRINKAGCLGRCAEGIACVLYPEGTWITNASLLDSEQDLEAMKALILSKVRASL